MVEVARELSGNPLSTAFFDYREANAKELWGASHKFEYYPHDKEAGVYEHINKLETTVLPLDAAANYLTFSGVLPMNEETEKGRDEVLAKITGLDNAAEILREQGPQALAEALTAAGIEAKSLEPSDVDVNEKAAVIFNPLMESLVDGVAEFAERAEAAKGEAEKSIGGILVLTEKVEALNAKVEALTKENKQLRADLALPVKRASEAGETVIDDPDAKAQIEVGLENEFDPAYPGMEVPLQGN